MCGNFSYFFHSLARSLTRSFISHPHKERRERELSILGACMYLQSLVWLQILYLEVCLCVQIEWNGEIKKRGWGEKAHRNFVYVLDWVVALCVHAYNKFIYKNFPMPSFKEIIYPKYFLLSFSFTRSHHDYIYDAIKNLFQHTFLLLNRNDIRGDEMRWW